MTNDELLSGFLDRSLSEDQLIEMEARKNAEPAFAHEVNEMLTVEKLLLTATPVITPPVDFLSSVESTVAAKVVAGSSSGGFLSLSSSTWLWILGASLVATTAFFTISTSLKEPSVERTNVERTPLKEQVEGTSLKEQVEGTDVERTPLKEQVEGTPLKEQVEGTSLKEPSVDRTNVEKTPLKVDAAPASQPRYNDLTTQSSEQALQGLLKDLKACRASGDHMRCSQIALNVGRTYRLRGSMDDAEENLTIALTEAKTAKLVQFEVEANGELGLVAQLHGDAQEARSRFNRAIELGTKNGIATDKWSKALQGLE